MLRHELSQKTLKRYLRYDEDTGIFTWLKTVNRGAKSGGVAGCVNKVTGYVHIKLFGVRHSAHRLAFLYMEGYMPEEVDHDNRIKYDNSWGNLVATTHSANMHNQPIRKDNTSGHTGVMYNKRSEKWCASIQVNNVRKALGVFINKADAINARSMANDKYNFHKNHGVRIPKQEGL